MLPEGWKPKGLLLRWTVVCLGLACFCWLGHATPLVRPKRQALPGPTPTTQPSTSNSVPDGIDLGELFPGWLDEDDGAALSECPENFACAHGTCRSDNGTFYCECEEGWTGPTCGDECRLDCGPHGTCHKDGTTSERYCVCSAFWTGPSCAEQLDGSDQGGGGDVATKAPSSVSSVPCPEEFTCRHGICRSEAGFYHCLCDKGWTGTFCANECLLDCGANGSCQVDGDTKEQYCACDWPWQGANCAELPPKTHPVDYKWVYWLGGGLAVGLVLLVVGVVVLMVYMWTRRFIVIMKIVHYFQPYEDEDGKLFDAFVSYRSCPEDMGFVYHVLRTKLEDEMNFHLCLHERDFIPGEPIANNILWATENSRRTILILSPRYLESEWARMEYQQAQYEALRRKQRIIPIMLQDISDYRDTMDPNLACILRTVTYLQHPDATADERQVEKFWKRLQLSMPKKSNAAITPADATSPSTLTSISTSQISLEPTHGDHQNVFGHPSGDKAKLPATTPAPPQSATKSRYLAEITPPDVRLLAFNHLYDGEASREKGDESTKSNHTARDAGTLQAKAEAWISVLEPSALKEP